MDVQIRGIRSSEFGELLYVLETAFPEASPETFKAQVERDSTFRLRQARVAMADGRLVGCLRIFSRTMLVRGVPIKVGGIGSVATLPRARGAGIATALLGDAIEVMRAEGMALSFLFTGIPAFYERLGYEIVREPYFEALKTDITSRKHHAWYYTAPQMDLSKDMRQLLAIYRAAIVGSTGSIVRTKQTWLDTRWWVDLVSRAWVARRDGEPVAYIRSRCREYGHQILEAECRSGHEDAVRQLVEITAYNGCACERIVALAPHAHPLAVALRALPSTVETTDVRYPMMMRVISEPLLREQLPGVTDLSLPALFPVECIRFWNTDRI